VLGFLDLPQDVLLHNIAPYLDTTHFLNEILPKSHKIIKKLSKDFIRKHHFDILKEKFKVLIRKCEETHYEKRYLLIYRVVQELGKPYSSLLLGHQAFRETVINKLIEFQDYENFDMSTPPISFKWFTMFQRCCKKTLEKIILL
jgi:hypothetical protein